MIKIEDTEVLIKLEKVENEIKELRSDLKRGKSIMELSGRWKDFKTEKGKSLEEVKEDIYENRKGSSRRFSAW